MQHTTHKITATNDVTGTREILFSGDYATAVRHMNLQYGDWNLDFSDIEIEECEGQFCIVAEADDESCERMLARSKSLENLAKRLKRDGDLWETCRWGQLFIERTDGSPVHRDDLPTSLRGSDLYWLCAS